MDAVPPVQETVQAPPASPPPLAPPPIISPPPPPPRGPNHGVWKALALIFLVLLVGSLFSHLVTFSHGVIPRSRSVAERSRTLEELVLEHTNSDNKIAVIDVDGVISSGSVDRSDMNLVDYIDEQLKMAERDSDVKA